MDGMKGPYKEYWIGGRTDHEALTGAFTMNEVNTGQPLLFIITDYLVNL